MQNIQLSIPTPCHENWSNMAPTEQGRFCNACAKQVVDFSSMSDKEVLNYFSTVKGSEVCGRVFPQQLERSIEIDPAKTKPFYHRYWNYAAMLLLLFKAGSVKAQGKIAVKPLPNRPVNNMLTGVNSQLITPDSLPPIMMGAMIRRPLPAKQVKKICKQEDFNGKVTDEKGDPLPFASVIVKITGESILSDSFGKFAFKSMNTGMFITVSSVGYEDVTVLVKESGQIIKLKKKETLLDEVVINSGVNTRRMGAMSCVTTCRIVKGSVIKRIINFNPSVSIYPNPVVKGNMLHVAVNFKKEGQYSLQITDASGRQVFQQTILAAAKNYLKEMVAERSWGSGMFIIRIADAKNNVLKTERFIAL